MRINNEVQSNIDFTKFDFSSWLDVGPGNGLVAQEWRELNDIVRKVAVDPGEDPNLLDGGEVFQHLDEGWEKFQEYYKEGSQAWDQEFDLVTMMDVIPYYMKPEGERVLDNLIKNTKKLLVIFTTDGYYPENWHISCWHAEDFEKRGMKTIILPTFHAGPPIPGDGLIAYKIYE